MEVIPRIAWNINLKKFKYYFPFAIVYYGTSVLWTMEGLDMTAENGAGMTNNNLFVPLVGGAWKLFLYFS